MLRLNGLSFLLALVVLGQQILFLPPVSLISRQTVDASVRSADVTPFARTMSMPMKCCLGKTTCHCSMMPNCPMCAAAARQAGGRAAGCSCALSHEQQGAVPLAFKRMFAPPAIAVRVNIMMRPNPAFVSLASTHILASVPVTADVPPPEASLS